MVVSVDALFSRNKLIGSRIIAAGSSHLEPSIKKTPSHVAILINKRWVHESTGKDGVHVSSLDKWQTHHEEVGRVSLQSEEYQDIADRYRNISGRKYDYLGVSYLGLWIAASKFGAKIPRINKWESKVKYFCCEALGYLTKEYYGMSAPVQILAILKGAKS